jgi:cobalt/nickel transport system permease protein
VALLLQAVIFGDGGILAFGANCFNMAFVLPYVGYYIYNFIVDKFGKGKNGVRYVAAAIGSYIGINLAALCASIEFGLQPLLFTDSLGNALYCPYPLSVSIPAMMIPHLAVAGVVEAIFTVAVYVFVSKTSPDLVYENIRTGVAQTAEANKKHIPVFALVAVLVVATPLGLIATAPAWGEWGADEIAEVVTNGTALGYVPSGLANGWALESIMPDYSLEGMNEVAAYILSAVIGVALLVIIFKLISLTIKEKSKT